MGYFSASHGASQSGDAVEVTGGKKKQDLIVGDASGSCRCTLWEADIDRLEDEQCYRLKELMVKEFRGEKYLSSTKEQSAIEEIGDIGDVEEEDEEEGASGCKQFDDVRVVGVDRLDNYSGRMKCELKVVVDAEDENMYEVRYATSNRRMQKNINGATKN